MNVTLDPDVSAQLCVMQWMHENGYHGALKALEQQLGRLYDDSQLPEASRLMQLVWRDCEEQLQAQQEADDEAGDSGTMAPSGRRTRREEALRLLRAGCDDYAGPHLVADSPPELHRANIIALRIVPGQDRVITAAGDGCVRCVRFGQGGGGEGGCVRRGADIGGAAEVEWEARAGSAALLSLALHPQYGSGLPLVAVGSMDGRVAVLHGPSGRILAEAQPHTKYVVRVAWGTARPQSDAAVRGEAAEAGASAAAAAGSAAVGGEGGGGNAGGGCAPQAGSVRPLLLATASNDETVGIHHLELGPDLDRAKDGGPASAADSTGRDGSGEAAGTGRLTTVKQVPYGASVADVAFLRDGRTLAVGVRGSNYIRLLDTEMLLQQAGGAGGGASGELGGAETLVNVNERGDDHVSFSPRQLVPSGCGRYLLVVTDSPRLLVLRTADWSRLRLLFGLPVDNFPQPVAAWHRDSNYIYAAGANAQLCVFHLGSGRLVASLRHHKINIRDLDYDPDRNLLASCSFDKTVKLMGPAQQGGAAAAGPAGA